MTYVETSLEHGVGRITLNRPGKRNALTRGFIEELQQAVTEMSQAPALRALVFSAEGQVFCAGMDLGEMQERAESANSNEQWQRDSQVYADLLTSIYKLPVPVVASIQGPVLAGGMGLILACDLLMAADSAFFALPEPMRGITAAMVTPLLVHRVGAGQASYLLLSGERISAARAWELGLVHAILPPDELEGRIAMLLKSILTGSPSALAITKRHIDACQPLSIEQEIRNSIDVSAQARATEDAREGLAAFLEKRKPKWLQE